MDRELITKTLERLANGENLSREEISDAMEVITKGLVSESEV